MARLTMAKSLMGMVAVGCMTSLPSQRSVTTRIHTNNNPANNHAAHSGSGSQMR
ncbi:hypothetical protein M758_10G006600 [Ceratodon purpureus]|nr:hypothetical protein M758_10G006600 [Ceratodon purpureus]